MSKKGFLFINLGTPDSSAIQDVKSYLKTFLMDKRVIQLPFLIRFFLVHAIIVPFRSKKSARAYQKIWLKQGSPLKVHTENLITKLQQNLQDETSTIAYAMRYGHPSIADTLKHLKNCDEITVLPLYPQYASATSGSCIAEVFNYFKNQEIIPKLHIIRDFYAHPAYLHALTESIKPYLNKSYHLLLSYHGLPENQLERIGCQPVCQGPCSSEIQAGKACYKQQCYLESKALAQALEIDENGYTVAFQSRLGKTPWIKPYTDETLKTLAKKGINNLMVACPSFVSDCLETLEEIGLEAKHQWQELGGQNFEFIPCLNDQDVWIKALKTMLAL